MVDSREVIGLCGAGNRKFSGELGWLVPERGGFMGHAILMDGMLARRWGRGSWGRWRIRPCGLCWWSRGVMHSA